MSVVTVSGLERRFGARRVLSGLDLQLDAGDRIAILGTNGAGKTTLVRILAGLLRPHAGEVRVCGSSPSDGRVRARIGVLTHQPFLYAKLTALENLRFWGHMYGVRKPDVRAAGLLEALGLDPSDSRVVAAYSQGMRQRVGLARALIHEPELLLLDEPFAGLDEPGETAVPELLPDGITLLVATHRPDRMAQLASRVVRLEDGKLQ